MNDTASSPKACPSTSRRFLFAAALVGFAAAAVYLARRTPWGDSAWDRAAWADALGAAAALAGAILAAKAAWIRRPPVSSGRSPFLSHMLRTARYALYALVLATIATWCLPSPRPHSVFRAFVLWVAALALLPAAWPRLGIWWRGRAGGKAGRVIDVVGFNLLLGFLLLEGGLRVLGALSPSPLLSRPDAAASQRVEDQRLRPGSTRLGFPVNSFGYYDAEPWTENRGQRLRILAAGDSFAVGMVPLPENFLVLAEAELSKEMDRPVEIVNVGLEGLGPREYLHQIETHARPFRCDAVLVCLFVGNDLIGLGKERDASLARMLLTAEGWMAPTVLRRLWRIGQERWRLGRRLDTVLDAPAAGDSNTVAGDDNERGPTFSRGRFLEIELFRARVALVDEPDDLRAAYDALGPLLEEMKMAASGQLVVALLPDEFQVNEALWRELLERSGVAADQVERDRPQRRIAALCESHGIPVIDLLPALREAEAEGRAYLLQDTHWNALGNAAAAAALAEELHAILPRPPADR